MTLQIEFWQLLGLLLSGLGAFWGVVKHSLGQSQHHLDERFTLQDTTREANHKALATRLDGMEQINRDEAAQWQRIGNISRACDYLELSGRADFAAAFTDDLSFPQP